METLRTNWQRRPVWTVIVLVVTIWLLLFALSALVAVSTTGGSAHHLAQPIR
jgi:hypothetical protein